MTYLTSPLSIPNPNAIVAQIQLQYRISYELGERCAVIITTHLTFPSRHLTWIISFSVSSIPAWYTPVYIVESDCDSSGPEGRPGRGSDLL